MRIARVMTRLNLGGPARQALAADAGLRQRGHELRLFTGASEPGEGDLYAEFERRGHDVVRVRGLVRGVAPAGDLLARRRLRRELAAFRPDVVHTHASKAGALGRAALRRGFESTARVHTFHGHVLEGYFPALVSRRLVAHERRLARDTDRVVAVSHATAEDLLRLGVVGEEKLVVIQPGIELEALLAIPRAETRAAAGALRARLGAGPDELLVGVVGRLAAVKRCEWALQVFALLAARFPRWHLVFVGDGSERKRLQAQRAALAQAAARRVHLLGAVQDMQPVLAELDVVLSTSRAEGMPVALIEAGAAGLPVVASDVGGVAELVAHERTGFLGGTVEELAFGLAQLLERPAERLAMGARARLRVAERHSGAQLARRLEELYRVVVGERQGGAARAAAAGGGA
jgi:glycosyltransferase involved in cell wall biosynthesis